MSNLAITWAMQQTGLTIPEKFMLVVLADGASDENFECWYSIQTIAKKIGCSPRYVQRLRAGLEAKKMIGAEKRLRGLPGGTTAQTSNMYSLSVPSEFVVKARNRGGDDHMVRGGATICSPNPSSYPDSSLRKNQGQGKPLRGLACPKPRKKKLTLEEQKAERHQRAFDRVFEKAAEEYRAKQLELERSKVGQPGSQQARAVPAVRTPDRKSCNPVAEADSGAFQGLQGDGAEPAANDRMAQTVDRPAFAAHEAERPDRISRPELSDNSQRQSGDVRGVKAEQRVA